MTTKHFLLIIALFTILSCRSQIHTRQLSFHKLKNDMIDFLVNKHEIDSERAKKLKNGEHTFYLQGVSNNLSEGALRNGMYIFSSLTSHKNEYFVLVENNSYIILDISTRKGLENSLVNTLDFCERNKFCVDIINDYVSKIIGVYYNTNKNPRAGLDTNCEKGIFDVKELP